MTAQSDRVLMGDILNENEIENDMFMSKGYWMREVKSIKPHFSMCCNKYHTDCHKSFIYITDPNFSKKIKEIIYFYCDTSGMLWRCMNINVASTYNIYVHPCYIIVSRSQFEKEKSVFEKKEDSYQLINGRKMLFNVKPSSPELETEEEPEYAPFVQNIYYLRKKYQLK